MHVRKGRAREVSNFRLLKRRLLSNEYIIKSNYVTLDLEELVQRLLNTINGNDIRTDFSNGDNWADKHFLVMVGLLCMAVVIAALLLGAIILLANYLKKMQEKVSCFIHLLEPLDLDANLIPGKATSKQ